MHRNARPTGAGLRHNLGGNMKLIPSVIATLAVALFATAAQAQVPPRRPGPVPPFPVPAPAPAREQVALRDVHQYYYGQGGLISVGHTLGVAPRAMVNSVIVIASSDDGRGMLSVRLGRRSLVERYLTTRLEVVQVPVNAQVGPRRELELVVSGNAYIATVGVTYVGDSFQPVPAPVPAPVPPAGPACELIGQGTHAGYNWNYRVRVNGVVHDASDNLDQALEKIRKLQQARVCFPSVAYQACELHGHGVYRGYNWNYRLQLGEGFIDASDNLQTILQITQKLQGAGLCQPTAIHQCNLVAAGVYRGYNWRHRIAIGDRVVDATDNLDTATQLLTTYRSAGFCY